jgi:indoleacetamide hydrolase
MAKDLWQLSGTEAVAQLASGRLKQADYLEALIDRAVACAVLNAQVDFDPDVLRAASPKPGPLHGLPISFKANIDIAGRLSSGATPALKDWRPPTTAPVAQALLNAGAVVFAKDNLHELALGSTSNNAATGAVHNPWNQSMISGGSSGGTAASIAAGMVAVGLGSDTAGSCRIPASLCGCVGFRPSMGRYPMDGVIPMTHQRDTVGPLARTVADIDLVDRIIDPARAAMPQLDPAKLRLGVPHALFWDDVDGAAKLVLDAALAKLTDAGATLVDIDLGLPSEEHLNALGLAVVARDMPRDIDAYLKAHDHPLSARQVIEAMAGGPERGLLLAQYGPEAIPQALYDEALQTHRPWLQSRIADVFARERLDALVLPATPLPARPIGQDATVDLNGKLEPTITVYIRSTDLACAAQLPSIAVPAGLTADGLPIGLMFDGLAGSDAHLLGVAAAFERLRGPHPFPPL